jgi:hypothetical protein
MSSAALDTSPGRHHAVGLLSLPAHKLALWLSVTKENRSWWAPMAVAAVPGARHGLGSAAEQMPQRLVEAGMAKPVARLLQPGRQHPLVGAGEFAGTLLAEQQPRSN